MDLQRGEGAEASGEGRAVIGPAFETVWPDVERRLRALLFRRGLDRASADDIVQEVALRALANHVTFASASDLLRWAGPVACNLHVDLVRHHARMLDAPQAEDHAADDDVPRQVAERIELQRAFRGIAALRPADREAIIEAVTSEQAVPRTRKEAVRLAVRRHRARSRLLVVLEQLAGWLGGWLAGTRVLRRGRRVALAGAMLPAAVAIPIIVTWHAPPAPSGARPARPAVAVPLTREATSVTFLTRPAPSAQRADATAARAARPRHAARPAPAVAAKPRPKPLRVDSPAGIGAEAGRDDRGPREHVYCQKLGGLPVDEICVL
ncbi:MAG: hypothetical protein QOE45_2323 [Frankiaceae bacterium]|jgi:DNA-directed RNA polymerase specialized sigma24 family protein|nr:hypothetical protein [Frankiaceae bacterium]